MTRRITARILGSMFLLAAVVGSSATLALGLDEAKTRGLVGETPDGYLGVVAENPSPEVKELVRDINDKRRDKYEEIAARNGTSVGVVEKLAGKKAIEKSPAGIFVKVPEGTWIQK